jgi:hypothetical protein
VSRFRNSSVQTGPETEALYGGENVVNGFCPTEGLRVVVVRVDKGADGRSGFVQAGQQFHLGELGGAAVQTIEQAQVRVPVVEFEQIRWR